MNFLKMYFMGIIDSNIQDGGGRHLEKSQYLGRGLTDFHQIWHGDAFPPSCAVRPSKVQNLENPRWRRPPSLKKIEKSPYFDRGLTNIDEI